MVKNIIIDIIGSFADGKTTLVRALTSESTLRHSEEKKRGITIRLGYAHFILYKCTECSAFSRHEKCELCGGKAEMFYRVSIIDSPGHKTLMTIMLSGAPLTSGAVLVVAANQTCPQPQTEEHLETIKIMGIKNLVVAQTKVDIVGAERAKKSKEEIQAFLAKNGFGGTKIIPVLSIHDINITELIQEIGKFSPIEYDSGKPKMLVVRSFDVNRPGTDISSLNGGVLGGGLVSGQLSTSDKIRIYPGVLINDTWKPIDTEVAEIQSEFGKEEKAVSGLMIGVKTKIDPSFARRDSLAGSLIVSRDNPPEFKDRISITYLPLAEKEKNIFKKPIQKNETVLLNILSSKILGTVISTQNNKITIIFNNSLLPYYIGDKAIISRKVDNVWVLAGSGTVYA
ncbi:MAG: translation initiation factor IF-2 subunit gamma [Candidatus Parvarchaeota archaeon]|nr:translation initiation factor IF-2 subunit gamma [Candidatus Parvarchaeota archaeon]